MKRLVPSSMYGDYPAQLAHFTRPSDGCWEFTGYILPTGYGQLGRNVGAHRVAWEVAHGRPIPAGLVIDHLCHNADPVCNDNMECLHRRCVNPDHLEAVPSAVNIYRGKGFSRPNGEKTHCTNGHEFTAANTYYRLDRFGRICRTCRDIALAECRIRNAERTRDQRRARARVANAESYAIREWAKGAGLRSSMHGPIAADTRAAYFAAISERAA